MSLGLGTNLTKGGLTTPGIITDNLVVKHNYSANGNIPVSDGAVYFDGNQDYIKITNSSSSLFTLGTSDIAWTGWVKAATDAASEKLFDAVGGSSDGFFIYI